MTQDELISGLIGKTIGLYPNEVINLLTTNGVVVDANALGLDQLIMATFSGINTNPVFKKELGEFIDSKNIISQESEFSNATGDWIGAGTALLGSVTGFLGSKDQLNAAKANANATLESNKLALEAEKLKLQGVLTMAQIQAQANNKPANNTALYIGLGVGGFVILGLMVFLITKK